MVDSHFTTRIYAEQLDAQDELIAYQQQFVVTDPALIYMDGNSLGRLPKATVERLHHVIDHEWGERLIRSWNEGWIETAGRVGGKIAQLIGAQEDEVVVSDATSVNLYRLALAAMQARPDRHTIVTDNLNFPSDLYILQGICRQLGQNYRLVVVPSADGVHGPTDGLEEAITDDTALVALSHTVFKTAYTYDMAAITNLAHDAGALTLWDLSHAAGSVPVDLNESNADLAVGCTYKYLNGGPGSPAFQYIHRDLQAKLQNPMQGWMGQAEMFEFGLEYESAPGVQRFQTGTPPVLAVSAIEPGVDMLLEAGMDRLRAKSVSQSEYLIALWETMLKPLGFTLNSPQNVNCRGSHISLGHDDAWRIDQALINEMSVLPDFRKPDNIRIGIAPIYNSFVDVYETVSRLARIVEVGIQERYSADIPVVT